MSPTESKSLPVTPAGQPVKAISVSDELTAAVGLQKSREEVAAAIVENRDLLRLLVARGYATDDQKAEIERVYPTPVRKPKPPASASADAPAGPPAEG